MENIIKVFNICDTQNRGLVLKEDLQEIRHELPLSDDEIEAVFDWMDTRRLGYLTLSDFFEVFNTEDSQNSHRSVSLTTFMEVLPKTHDLLHLLNDRISKKESSLVPLWRRLILNLEEELEEIHTEKRHLTACNGALKQERESLITMYDQLETEMTEESMRAVSQEKERAEQQRLRFEEKLHNKERQLHEMAEQQKELMDRINGLFRKKKSYKKEYEALLKLQESYLKEIESQKEAISQLEEQFDTFREGMMKECERRFKEGFEMGRDVAKIEEQGIMEELDILQDICNSLKATSRPLEA